MLIPPPQVERGKTAVYKRRVHAKWRGLYDDVPKQALRVALVERGRFGGTGELDAVLINLEQIAGGSIQQEVAFSERDGRRVIETYRASFHIYFQERSPSPSTSPTGDGRALSIPRDTAATRRPTQLTPPLYTHAGAPRT